MIRKLRVTPNFIFFSQIHFPGSLHMRYKIAWEVYPESWVGGSATLHVSGKLPYTSQTSAFSSGK